MKIHPTAFETHHQTERGRLYRANLYDTSIDLPRYHSETAIHRDPAHGNQ